MHHPQKIGEIERPRWSTKNMSTFNLRDRYVQTILGSADDVLDADVPSDEFLDELFGSMVTAADVRIIIVGQDAYPDKTKRCAMAFSYPIDTPASDSNLSLIIAANKGKDDHNDLEAEPIDGWLGSWRDQGVLLINSRGNVPFIKSLMQSRMKTSGTTALVRGEDDTPIGILLGRSAIEETASLFPVSFSWGHPSARSIKNNDPSDPENWIHTDVFWRSNQHLLRTNRGFIDWSTVFGTTRVYLFCDGGHSVKNSISKAGVVVYSGFGSYLADNVVVNTYTYEDRKNVRLNTNNIAELTALRMSFDAIAETVGIDGDKTFIIYSDSKYSIGCITEWYHSWVKKDILAEKKNTALIGEIVEEYESMPHTIRIRHTRGHQPTPSKHATELEQLVYRGNTHVDSLVTCA